MILNISLITESNDLHKTNFFKSKSQEMTDLNMEMDMK